nr:unnamed protein product [Digitaria exilis]
MKGAGVGGLQGVHVSEKIPLRCQRVASSSSLAGTIRTRSVPSSRGVVKLADTIQSRLPLAGCLTFISLLSPTRLRPRHPRSVICFTSAASFSGSIGPDYTGLPPNVRLSALGAVKETEPWMNPGCTGGAIWCATVAHRPRDAKSSACREGRYPPTWRGARVPRAIPTGVEREMGGSEAEGEQGSRACRRRKHKSAQNQNISRERGTIKRKENKSNTNREEAQIEHKSRIALRPTPPHHRRPVELQPASASSPELSCPVVRTERERAWSSAPTSSTEASSSPHPSRRHLLYRAGLLHGELEEELEAVAGCLAAPPRQPRAATSRIEEEEAESNSRMGMGAGKLRHHRAGAEALPASRAEKGLGRGAEQLASEAASSAGQAEQPEREAGRERERERAQLRRGRRQTDRSREGRKPRENIWEASCGLTPKAQRSYATSGRSPQGRKPPNPDQPKTQVRAPCQPLAQAQPTSPTSASCGLTPKAQRSYATSGRSPQGRKPPNPDQPKTQVRAPTTHLPDLCAERLAVLACEQRDDVDRLPALCCILVMM